MSDIRLLEIPFELEDKTYQLRCNFNVLADVTEEYGGELPDPFDKATQLRVCLSFLAAMVNDYADEQGWPERYTPKELGRTLDTEAAVLLRLVMPLVVQAVFARSGTQPEDAEKKEDQASR